MSGDLLGGVWEPPLTAIPPPTPHVGIGPRTFNALSVFQKEVQGRLWTFINWVFADTAEHKPSEAAVSPLPVSSFCPESSRSQSLGQARSL